MSETQSKAKQTRVSIRGTRHQGQLSATLTGWTVAAQRTRTADAARRRGRDAPRGVTPARACIVLEEEQASTFVQADAAEL